MFEGEHDATWTVGGSRDGARHDPRPGFGLPQIPPHQLSPASYDPSVHHVIQGYAANTLAFVPFEQLGVATYPTWPTRLAGWVEQRPPPLPGTVGAAAPASELDPRGYPVGSATDLFPQNLAAGPPTAPTRSSMSSMASSSTDPRARGWSARTIRQAKYRARQRAERECAAVRIEAAVAELEKAKRERRALAAEQELLEGRLEMTEEAIRALESHGEGGAPARGAPAGGAPLPGPPRPRARARRLPRSPRTPGLWCSLDSRAPPSPRAPWLLGEEGESAELGSPSSSYGDGLPSAAPEATEPGAEAVVRTGAREGATASDSGPAAAARPSRPPPPAAREMDTEAVLSLLGNVVLPATGYGECRAHLRVVECAVAYPYTPICLIDGPPQADVLEASIRPQLTRAGHARMIRTTIAEVDCESLSVRRRRFTTLAAEVCAAMEPERADLLAGRSRDDASHRTLTAAEPRPTPAAAISEIPSAAGSPAAAGPPSAPPSPPPSLAAPVSTARASVRPSSGAPLPPAGARPASSGLIADLPPSPGGGGDGGDGSAPHARQGGSRRSPSEARASLLELLQEFQRLTVEWNVISRFSPNVIHKSALHESQPAWASDDKAFEHLRERMCLLPWQESAAITLHQNFRSNLRRLRDDIRRGTEEALAGLGEPGTSSPRPRGSAPLEPRDAPQEPKRRSSQRLSRERLRLSGVVMKLTAACDAITQLYAEYEWQLYLIFSFMQVVTLLSASETGLFLEHTFVQMLAQRKARIRSREEARGSADTASPSSTVTADAPSPPSPASRAAARDP